MISAPFAKRHRFDISTTIELITPQGKWIQNDCGNLSAAGFSVE
jgi:hypothetical protein